MKFCRDCKETKDDEQFHRDKRRSDGLSFYCRQCVGIRKKADYVRHAEQRKTAATAWRVANPERKRANSLKWRTKNKERQAELAARWYQNNREHARELQRKNYRDNKERYDKINREWQEKNPEAVRVIKRRWKQTNKDAVRLCEKNRRARQLSSTMIPFTPDQLSGRWAYYGNKCWICRSSATETDHVKPLSRDGAHMLCNLRPICGTCNRSKGAKWPYHIKVRAL